MEGFKASFINEIEKMYKKKKAVVVVILSLVVIVIGQLIVFGIQKGFGILTPQFPLMVLSVFANTILPLFTALVAIDVFAGEFSSNTMKIAIARPVTRFKLFSAKFIATAFFALVNILIVMVLSIIVWVLFNSSSITVSGFLHVLISYIVTLFPILSLSLVIIFLANIFKSGTAVFFLSIVLFFSFKILATVFSQYSSIFITSTLNWYDFWNLDTISKVFSQFMIILGYGIMFFTAGYYLFDKKDL